MCAEGLPAESYLDTGNRGAFANAGQPAMLHPDFGRGVWAHEGCAPLVLAGPPLARIRARLLARARALGHALTEDPGPGELVDGVPVAPFVHGGRVIVRVPPGARELRPRSRCRVPGASLADSEDVRRLGAGWHQPEGRMRWTDGDAATDVRGVRRVDFDLVATGRYWTGGRARSRVAG